MRGAGRWLFGKFIGCKDLRCGGPDVGAGVDRVGGIGAVGAAHGRCHGFVVGGRDDVVVAVGRSV